MLGRYTKLSEEDELIEPCKAFDLPRGTEQWSLWKVKGLKEFFFYLLRERLREQACMHVCEPGRGREKTQAGSVLSMHREPNVGLDLINSKIMT